MDKSKGFDMDIISLDIGDMTVSVLKSAAFGQIHENEQCDPHFHTHFEFQYIKSGTMVLEGDSQSFPANQDEFILIPPGSFHTNGVDDKFLRFTLMFSIMQNGKNENGASEYCHYSRILESVKAITVFHDDKVSNAFRTLIETGIDTSPMQIHILKLNLSVLLISILQCIEKNNRICKKRTPAANGAKTSTESEQMKFIIENCILLHFASDNTSAQIAKTLNMSNRNCSRIVKNLLGKSVSKLVTEQRMHIAKALITKTDRQLCDIAESVGYKTYVAFFTAFKKHYGISPNLLRQ